MSRIGIQPIDLPDGVKATLTGNTLKVNGKGGNLELDIKEEISLEILDKSIVVKRCDDTREVRAFHGLFRSLVANMVHGVSVGFEKKLDIIGVGYRADVQGSVMNLALGYSHPIKYELPKGIKATVDKQTSILIQGADKQVVGQVAADIRSMRPPEPYKGKGIKYADETIRRKAGKAGKGAGG
ncbi:MAG: 50S ribosomal protein L6 [Proteobacteria bacterium]|nr:50S ribosomal protein L6 [Pseudomonadota bacterium]